MRRGKVIRGQIFDKRETYSTSLCVSHRKMGFFFLGTFHTTHLSNLFFLNHRATQGFSIHTSQDNSVYSQAYAGALQNPFGKACEDVQLEVFEINQPAKYVKVILETYIPGSSGIALQHFDMEYAFLNF